MRSTVPPCDSVERTVADTDSPVTRSSRVSATVSTSPSDRSCCRATPSSNPSRGKSTPTTMRTPADADDPERSSRCAAASIARGAQQDADRDRDRRTVLHLAEQLDDDYELPAAKCSSTERTRAEGGCHAIRPAAAGTAIAVRWRRAARPGPGHTVMIPRRPPRGSPEGRRAAGGVRLRIVLGWLVERNRPAWHSYRAALIDAWRTQIWPLPAIGIAAAAIVGTVLPRVDAGLQAALPPELLTYFFDGGRGAARRVSAAVAGSW